MPIESARIAIIAILALLGMFLADKHHADHSNASAAYTDTGGRQ